MSRWTDEELGTLLRETFASHEELASPERARQLAGPGAVARRCWVVPAAVAATVVLVAGVSVAIRAGVGSDDSPTTPATTNATTPPVPQSPATDSHEANVAAAAAESERLITTVPLPDGAVRQSGEPPGGSVGEEGIGPSDPRLSRTAWWTVPVPPERLMDYLQHHAPDGLTLDIGYGTSGDVTELSYDQDASPAPTAYRPFVLLVRFKSLGSGSVVRADTFSGAYDTRPAAAALGDVTSVDVSRSGGQEARPGARELALPADRDAITALVNAFTALPGSMEPPAVLSCPAAIGPPVEDVVAFHETGGGIVTATLRPTCFGQVQVARDGVRVRPTLDPGRLDEVVRQVLGVD